MDVFESMKRRRMHRQFTAEPVGAEALERLVWAAGRAPMGGAELVRRLIVVTDPALLKTVQEVTPSLLVTPAAIIAICTDLDLAERVMGTQGRNILSLLDSGAAAENVALAAVALGLGVCFFRSSNEEALRIVFELPDNVRPDLLIAVGHPVEKPSGAPRGPKPVVYKEVYGLVSETAK
jgi:nitroreductase